MRIIPSDAVFAAHGLHNVVLDIPGIRSTTTAITAAFQSAEPLDASEWLAGSATLTPTERFQLLVPLNDTSNVRFSFCPAADSGSMARFRRQAQLLALDTIPNAPGPSRRYGRVRDVIAWWEDGHGLWFIVQEDTEGEIKLVESWSRIMADPGMDDVVNDDEGQPYNVARVPADQRSSEMIYGDISGLLLKIVECLMALHDRNLSLISCRPSTFSIFPGPQGNDLKVRLSRFDYVLPLPSHGVQPILQDTPLASSTLFPRDGYDPAPLTIEESVLRKNLRYLAPETAISKRLSPTSDIYSFGVLAHEMLTGATIDGGPDSPEETDVDVLIDFHRHVTMDILPPRDWLEREGNIGYLTPVLPPKELSDIIMRCLGKEPDTRYASLDSLAYDLSKLCKICRQHGDLSKFKVGEIDDMSRFTLPERPVAREEQVGYLKDALESITRRQEPENRGPRVINVSGASGSGKTRVVRQFVIDAESEKGPSCTVAWAKLEESIHPPLSSFIQIFISLLDQILADPDTDITEWNEKIRQAVGSRFHQFVSILPNEYRRALGVKNDVGKSDDVDWATLRGNFVIWCRSFLQIFATNATPLILIIDDIQWMPSDEAGYWRQVLDGSQTLSNTLVVTTCRVERDGIDPKSSLFLSLSCTNIHVPLLSEEAVLSFLKACFHDRLTSSNALASFLHSETGGSALYLRTVVATLVKDQVIGFDFERLTWQSDTVQLQEHLSKAGVDSYLEKLILSLPPDVQELLFYASCLPSRGFTIEQVAELVNKPVEKVEMCVKAAISTATLLVASPNIVCFSHDGPKSVTYRLIPRGKAAIIHERVSQFLRAPVFDKQFLFDAADHALLARELGARTTNDEEFVDLLLDACGHTALATSFNKAKRFIEAAEQTIEASGSLEIWLSQHRRTYMRFLHIYAEIYGALGLYDPAFNKLHAAIPYCKTDGELLRLAAWRVRLKIAAGQLHLAVKLTLTTLADQGHDIPSMRKRMTGLLHSPQDVLDFEKTLKDVPIDPEDPRILIMSLIGAAGSSIYYCEPEIRKLCFGLGLSLAMEMKLYHETTAYFLVTHGMTNDDHLLRRALITLARSMLDRCPLTYLSGHARSGLAAIVHHWLPWTSLNEDLDAAFDTNVANANYEQATNVLMTDFGTRALAGTHVPLETLCKKYETVRPYINPSGRFIIELPLQYAERILKCSRPCPWILEGNIVPQTDTERFSSLAMHSAIRHCLALRLATFYDAPLQDIQAIVKGGMATAAGVQGLVFGTEWSFLVALFSIRSSRGEQDQDTKDAIASLAANNLSPDFAARLNVLKSVIAIEREHLNATQIVDATIEDLTIQSQHALSGLLSYYMGQAILKTTSSHRLAGGFIRGAFASYREAQMFGLCAMLREKYPQSCPVSPQVEILPSQALGVIPTAPPTIRRVSMSTLTDSTPSFRSSGDSTTLPETPDSKPAGDDELDTLALMRSSLALASEQDPSVLLCTLLRILCQFLRAEYAAIALCDEVDKQQVRLKAAGPFSRIVSYDLKITDEASRHVCPSSLILHTARTGKSIMSISSTSRFRTDSFFHSRLPRSLICLPILSQGVQSGVILLSSNTTTITQIQWEAAKEVISTLATFATIITSNVSFTKRLKSEVDQRTKELQNALAAKTVFLSQCSHELRSPLTAVLGMATILEESPGLSDVQKDYLRTIVTSGEDLLGLINNILDHSRLEAGSVTLEHTPFTLRDVVESSLDSVAPAAQKKNIEICLISPYDTDPPGLLGDAFRIKQILLNLLSNAVKFTAEGRVNVKWHWETCSDGKIAATIDVMDTGIGIPASKMDKLFRSFSQVDESITRSFGGSGLGLIISKDLARLLGGDCTATSEYGRGSTFSFSLVADRDPNFKQSMPRFTETKSCFVISGEGPKWDMLNANLNLLNCQPIRFTGDLEMALEAGYPHGLNDGKQYDFVLINTDMIDKPKLRQMKQLQPNSTILYMVKSLKLSEAIREFGATRESIISRPIKFSSLVRAMMPSQLGGRDQSSVPESTTQGGKKGMNRGLAKACPLDILLVDDNATNLNVGKRILEIFGYKNVVTASDGQQAIDAAESKTYDLILLDLQMPVVDGFTAQKRIRNSPLAGDPCIVALTANADLATQQLCNEAHFFDYLSKPLNLPILERILGKVYEHRQNEHITKHRAPSESATL